MRDTTLNGSLAIIKLTLNKKANKNEINDLIRNAHKGNLVNQIKFEINQELFHDIIGNTCASFLTVMQHE